MKFKLFFAKYGFWLVVSGIIIGVYGYGMWYRHNAEATMTSIFSVMFPGAEYLEQIPGLGDFITNTKDAFNSDQAFEAMKNEDFYKMMSLPEKFKFNLAFLTKKTMPLAALFIIVMALILRTKFSATVDIYTVERQAALDAARNIDPVVVEAKIINSDNEVPTNDENLLVDTEPIMLDQTETPLIEQKSSMEIDSDSMDIF